MMIGHSCGAGGREERVRDPVQRCAAAFAFRRALPFPLPPAPEAKSEGLDFSVLFSKLVVLQEEGEEVCRLPRATPITCAERRRPRPAPRRAVLCQCDRERSAGHPWV